MKGILLKNLELEGFRYVKDKIRLNLDFNTIVLLGPVGSGKTTVLNAIEYAMFGTTYDIRTTKLLKLDDLINDFSNTTRIRLEFVDQNGNNYVIIRWKERGKPSKGSFLVNGKQVLENAGSDSLTEEIMKVIGLSVDDFSRQIYVRHRELEAIIYGSPSQRAAAIDRLFGIAVLEQIFRAISTRMIEEKIAELKKRLDIIDSRLEELDVDVMSYKIEELETALKDLEDRRSELIEELNKCTEELELYEEIESEYSKLKEEMAGYRAIISQLKKRLGGQKGLSSSLLRVEALKRDLIDFLEELLLHNYSEKIRKIKVSVSNVSQLIALLEECGEAVESVRKRVSQDLFKLRDQISEAEANRHSLLANIKKLSARAAMLEPYQKEYEKLLREIGRVETVKKKLETLEKKLAEIQGRITYLSGLRNVMLGIFSAKETKCPICDSQLNLEKLRRKIDDLSEKSEHQFKEQISIERKITELKISLNRFNEIIPLVAELNNVNRDLNTSRLELERVEAELADLKALMEEAVLQLSEIDEMLGKIRKTLRFLRSIEEKSRVLKDLNTYRVVLEETEKRLKELNYDPEYVELLRDKYYELQGELRQIDFNMQYLKKEHEKLTWALDEALRLQKERNTVKKKLSLAIKLRDDILVIKRAFRASQRKLREETLSKINSVMNEVFKKIYVYDDFNALEIRVERSGVGEYERSEYEIYARRSLDGAWIPALRRMSDGQKSIVALCLLTALFRTAPHKISFLILDEPIPNIDQECREAMIRAFSELKEIKQIIVATQDPRYSKLVRDAAKIWGESYKGVVYKFMHGGSGPVINVE